MRSLDHELGVTGETDKYPDSLFYSGENTNVNLTYADRGAIAILYGPGLSPGMTADDVKKDPLFPLRAGSRGPHNFLIFLVTHGHV